MIKQKHSFGKKEYSFKEEFIDREDAKKLYRDKLYNNTKDYNILVFYGVGGIGKSKLKDEICRMHKEGNKETLIMYLDLNAADDRNLGSGILKLVDSASEKVDFKCFEMAYALYYRKKNPGAVYGREKEMITNNALVGIGLNILGIFDNGVTSTAAEIVERTIRTISNRTIDKDVKEELKHFDDYSITEMEEMLPLFFQYDLKNYLEKHQDTYILIVFDTFEGLNENVIEQIRRNKNERWVQDIISYFSREEFPNLLITIFGRDEIVWDSDWQSMLDQFQLTEFEDDFSEEYLKKAGIEDQKIKDAIKQSSKGLPLVLYLSLETYINIKNNGGEPRESDFEGDYPQIIERFLYNLDKDTVEVLRLMSIPNFYNISVFDVLIKEFNISFPLTEFEQFNKYSFVTYDDKEKDYYIHDLIRKNIIDKTPESTIKQAHRQMLKYYSEQTKKDDGIKNLLELFYHARKSKTVEDFNEWLMLPVAEGNGLTPIDMLKKHQEKGEQNILLQLIDGIRTEYELKTLLIDLINIYIDIVHLGGEYSTAVSMCDKYLEPYSLDQIMENEQLIKMRIRKIHHSMFYMPVDVLIKDAESILENVNIKKYPEQYNELLFLLGGNLGMLYGDLSYCTQWLDMSMMYAKKHNMDAFVHRTLRKQADVLLANNQIEEALDLVDPVVSINSSMDDLNSRYKIYLMGVLGEIYRKKGDLSNAYHCYDMVEKKATEQHMNGWKPHAYLGKGMVEMEKKDFDSAEDHFNSALGIYGKINQEWGKINTLTALYMLYLNQGRPIPKDALNVSRDKAREMHYQYNEKILNELIDGKKPYLELFFL